ncbi:MAG: FHA domain-containing protein, partial [Proteobacteria bacterium]|nr:FHA domain-containing protein [Pseudomonadota bacterium]
SGAGPALSPASGAGPALSPASGAGPVLGPASGAGPVLSPAPGVDQALSPSVGDMNSAPLGQPVAAQAPVAAEMPAPAPQPLIPALASSATQLPGQSLSSLDDFDDADGGIATQAVPKPSAADIERAIAEMNAANAAAQASAPSFDDGPIFGGAATEDGEELQYENDDPDNAGERTMMIDAAPDDDLDDIGGEKTQISMGAMEFDPLCGKLIVEAGKTSQREYILVREKTSIGRAPNNDISISDIAMSRKHVEIDKFPEGFRIKDLDSGNGTVLNGYRIRVGQLRNNDIIEIGGIRFRFEQSGGDPDVLWHGEPKIEYHPNQKGGARPPAPGQANSSPSPSMPSQPVSLAKPEPQQPQQMESMLQRQNGGLGAPGWAPATMTSPYMMSYTPNALRNARTTPVWANTLMVVLSVLCVASIIFLGFSVFRNQNIESEYEVAQNQVANVQKIFVECANYYKESAFDQAQDTLNKIDEVDKDNTILPDRELVAFYTNLIGEEKDLYSKIRKIRDKPVGVPTIEEYEEDLKLLREVPDSSVNMKLVPTVLQRTADGYHRKLKKEIREQVAQNNISEARKLLAKMSNLPEVQTDNDVKTLGKLISDKEKARR